MAMTAHKTNWLEIGLRLLSLLILPILGFGVTLYTDASVTREKITQIQQQTQQNQTQIESVDSRINQISQTVTETNGQVHELRTVLEIIRQQVSRSSGAQR